MYVFSHSERLDLVDKNTWIKSDRFSKHSRDTPLTENGIKIANQKINEILTNENMGSIYSSPFTRCIQTSLEFQKAIKNKYDILIPIKIEYGLCHEFINQHNLNQLNNSKIIIKNNKIESVTGSYIDKYLENKSIFNRYNKKNFDIKYKSIMTIKEINNEKTLYSAFNKRFNTILKISEQIDFNKINIIVTHNENITAYKSFIEQKWNFLYDFVNLFPHNKFCFHIKLNIKNDKLFIEKINV
jgi:hypothetical protein